ncbi:MAG: transglutaminase family protein [Acidimicrobiia bacterium]|nr:transglutaminase family protein [Acidimicrobiia bacterium]
MTDEPLATPLLVTHAVEYRFNPPALLGPHCLRLVPMVGEPTIGRSTLTVDPRPRRRRDVTTSDGVTTTEVRFDGRLGLLRAEGRSAVDPTGTTGTTGAPPTTGRADVGSEEAVRAAVQCCGEVAAEIRYVERHDPEPRSLEDVMASGEGSCRDMAWMAHHRLTSAGWRSRVVTGWLLPHRPADDPVSWSGLLHAWVDVATTDGRWAGIDPTTAEPTGPHHVRLACGTESTDVDVVVGATSPAGVTVASSITVSNAAARPE